MSQAVHSRELLVPGPLDWIKLYTFWYDGETYEYVFQCGPSTLTPRQAEDIAKRENFRHAAQLKFLRDVDLEKPQR